MKKAKGKRGWTEGNGQSGKPLGNKGIELLMNGPYCKWIALYIADDYDNNNNIKCHIDVRICHVKQWDGIWLGDTYNTVSRYCFEARLYVALMETSGLPSMQRIQTAFSLASQISLGRVNQSQFCHRILLLVEIIATRLQTNAHILLPELDTEGILGS